MESVRGGVRWNGLFRRARRPFVSAMRNAFANFHRTVKPATAHDLFSAEPLDREFGLRRGTPVDRYYMSRWGDYWRFTSLCLRTLLAGHFSTVEITAFGNLFAATALLHGMAAEECEQARLDAVDADYEVVICARAVRS